MQTLKKTLNSRLSGAGRIAVLGVGSDLRADDASGMIAAENLRKALSGNKRRLAVRFFFGGTAPENLTGEIKRFKPSHLIMIDTIDMGARAGSTRLFKPEDIGEGSSFSTHKMPAKVLIDYLVNSCGCSVTVVGIQPKSVRFGGAMSVAVRSSAEKLAIMLADVIIR